MMASEYTQIVMKTPVEHVGTLSEFKNNVNAPTTESSGFEDTFIFKSQIIQNLQLRIQPLSNLLKQRKRMTSYLLEMQLELEKIPENTSAVSELEMSNIQMQSKNSSNLQSDKVKFSMISCPV